MSEKRESRIRGMTSSREKALNDLRELKISGKTRLDQVLEVIEDAKRYAKEFLK